MTEQHLTDIEVYKCLGYKLKYKTHRSGRLRGKREYWIIDPNNERVAPDPQHNIYATWYATPEKAWSNLLNGRMHCYSPRYTLDLNLAWRLLKDVPDIISTLPLDDPEQAAQLIVTTWLQRKS